MGLRRCTSRSFLDLGSGVARANHFASPNTTVQEGEGISGLAAYPGIVEGQVRCITDPKSETLQQGEILVCYRTDPGWVPLFPAAAAILVERLFAVTFAVVARACVFPRSWPSQI